MRVARLRRQLCLLGASSDSFGQYWVPLTPRTDGTEEQGNVAGTELSAWTSIGKLDMFIGDTLERRG